MPRTLRRAWLLFHATLGGVVFVESVRTAIHAYAGGRRFLIVLASIEAFGALLFLTPPTLRAGALAMLATFAVAFLFHAAQAEFHFGLLVYAAGAILVAAGRGRGVGFSGRVARP